MMMMKTTKNGITYTRTSSSAAKYTRFFYLCTYLRRAKIYSTFLQMGGDLPSLHRRCHILPHVLLNSRSLLNNKPQSENSEYFRNYNKVSSIFWTEPRDVQGSGIFCIHSRFLTVTALGNLRLTQKFPISGFAYSCLFKSESDHLGFMQVYNWCCILTGVYSVRYVLYIPQGRWGKNHLWDKKKKHARCCLVSFVSTFYLVFSHMKFRCKSYLVKYYLHLTWAVFITVVNHKRVLRNVLFIQLCGKMIIQDNSCN